LRFAGESAGSAINAARRVTDPLGEAVMRGIGIPETAIAEVLAKGGGHAAAGTAARAERAAAGEATEESAEAAAARARREALERDAAQAEREAAEREGAGRQADDAAKAAQLPEAIAAARAICETNDLLHPSPPPAIVVAELTAALIPRFRWIEAFGYDRIAPGHYQIFFYATPRHVTDPDYSTDGATPGAPDRAAVEERIDDLIDQYEDVFRQSDSLTQRLDEIGELAARDPALALRQADELEHELRRLSGGELPGRGAIGEDLRAIDRPVGAPPIESGVRGSIGEATHAAEVVARPPRRSTQLFPGDILALRREQLLRGEITLREFVEMFPEEGAAQVFMPTGLSGGRYIDHMYLDGGIVVLRESKNVTVFRLIEEYRLQLDKDIGFLRFADARIEWRISGNIDAEAFTELQRLAAENPGRFTFVLDSPGPYTFSGDRFIVPRGAPEVVRGRIPAAATP
jgi:hypothetical protein